LSSAVHDLFAWQLLADLDLHVAGGHFAVHVDGVAVGQAELAHDVDQRADRDIDAPGAAVGLVECDLDADRIAVPALPISSSSPSARAVTIWRND
jgi:hypothetical protein